MTQTPTPTLEDQLRLLVQDFALDVKRILVSIGDTGELDTASTASLVEAINSTQAQVQALASQSGAIIDDAAGDGVTTSTWSANRIFDFVSTGLFDLRSELVGGSVSAALDTFRELAESATGQESAILTLTTLVGEGVRHTEQALTPAQRAQARTNILAASQAELDTLEGSLGDVSVDLRAVYRAARDAP